MNDIFNTSGWIENIGTLIVQIFYPVDVNSKEWRTKVAEEIYQKVMERRQEIAALVLDEIQNICLQTTTDLEVIHDRLQEFRRKVLPSDQKQSKYFLLNIYFRKYERIAVSLTYYK